MEASALPTHLSKVSNCRNAYLRRWKCLRLYLELSEHFCSRLPNLIWTKLLPKQWMKISFWAASFTPPPLFFDPVTLSLPTGALEVFSLFLEEKYFFVSSLEMLFLQAEMDLWCAVNLQREGEVWKHAKYVFLLPTIIWGKEDEKKGDFPSPDNLFGGNHNSQMRQRQGPVRWVYSY